jgi:hypothetical protein
LGCLVLLVPMCISAAQGRSGQVKQDRGQRPSFGSKRLHEPLTSVFVVREG